MTPSRLSKPLVSLGGLVALVYSAWFTWRYFQPVPWMDQWDWVGEYKHYLSGHFGLNDLIAQHNEHRIATARLFLLADTIFFQMTGRFTIIANFLCLLCLGYLLSVALRRPGLRNAPFGLPWVVPAAFIASPCQWENLVWPFQIQFTLMCLFSVASALALARATETTVSRRDAIAWSLLAGTAYWLATFSMAGGMLSLPGLLLIPLLRRPGYIGTGLFLALALSAVAAFLHGFHHPGGIPLPPAYDVRELLRLTKFAALLCGSALHVQGCALQAGFLGFALTAFCFAGLLIHRYRGRAIPAGPLVLLSMVLFVIINAWAAAISRSFGGIDAATPPRYAILSLLFLLASVGLAAATAELVGVPSSAFLLRRTPFMPVLALSAIAAVDLPAAYARDADKLKRELSIAAIALEANVNAAEMTRYLSTEPEPRIDALIWFLHKHRLGVFATYHDIPGEVGAALANTDIGTLPVCAGGATIAYRVDRDAFVMGGWLAAPDLRQTVGWVGVKRGPDILAAVPSLVEDAPAPIRVKHAPRLGFLLASRHDPGEGALTLVGITGGHAVCAAAAGPLTPLLIQPRSVQQVVLASLEGAPAATGDFMAGPPPSDGPLDLLPGRSWTSMADGTISWRVVPPQPAGSALAVPFAVSVSDGRHIISFTFADGSKLVQQLPQGHWLGNWRIAALPSALLTAHPGVLTITLLNAGGWMSVGAPEIVSTPGDAGKLY